ncbi:MAG: hypothetical protein RLZZ133_1267, partial [Pseudomonadota bacterium]
MTPTYIGKSLLVFCLTSLCLTAVQA